jgi:hypothetical protein
MYFIDIGPAEGKNALRGTQSLQACRREGLQIGFGGLAGAPVGRPADRRLASRYLSEESLASAKGWEWEPLP